MGMAERASANSFQNLDFYVHNPQPMAGARMGMAERASSLPVFNPPMPMSGARVGMAERASSNNFLL